MNTLKKKDKGKKEYKAYSGSGSPYTTGASYKNGGPKKPSLVKAKNGITVKDEPKPNPYSLQPKPNLKDVGSTSPKDALKLTPLGKNESKGPKTPMDVINKNTKKPGKVGQFINKVKSNIQERKLEKLREKEYKKNPKMDSYKVGGMTNSNARVLADKTPGSKGTKVGLNRRVPKPGKKC